MVLFSPYPDIVTERRLHPGRGGRRGRRSARLLLRRASGSAVGSASVTSTPRSRWAPTTAAPRPVGVGRGEANMRDPVGLQPGASLVVAGAVVPGPRRFSGLAGRDRQSTSPTMPPSASASRPSVSIRDTWQSPHGYVGVDVELQDDLPDGDPPAAARLARARRSPRGVAGRTSTSVSVKRRSCSSPSSSVQRSTTSTGSPCRPRSRRAARGPPEQLEPARGATSTRTTATGSRPSHRHASPTPECRAPGPRGHGDGEASASSSVSPGRRPRPRRTAGPAVGARRIRRHGNASSRDLEEGDAARAHARRGRRTGLPVAAVDTTRAASASRSSTKPTAVFSSVAVTV